MTVRKVLMVLVPLVFIGAGVVAAVVIFKASPAPARAAISEQAQPVEVVEIRTKSTQSTISATGIVQPAREINIIPEVTGRVVARADELIPGGRFREGEVIARIDGRQFRYALRQEEARVRSAELELRTEESRRNIAERDWEILGDDRPREEASLALRQPHLETAQSSVDSARSGVDIARLNVGRTTLRAPFNSVVVEAQAEVGQLVSPNSRLATLVGTDELWVRVSVPVSRLEEIDIPGVNADVGAPARVVHVLGQGREVVRQGRVLRLEGQIDSDSRTGRILVVVDHPMDEPEGEIPLLPGAYVRVELEGRSVEAAIELPRSSIHQGTNVWVVTDENRLSRRTFEQIWGDEESLFVRSNELDAGDRIVVSPLSTPLEGALVQVTSPRANQVEP